MLTVSPPEQGQLVSVRRRQWVVSEVAASALPVDALLPTRRGHHLVTLQCIEDDAMGEELQVIWEVEPGARTYEAVPLPRPDGFDDPRVLDAFLNAVRWGAVSSADRAAIQSPFRSGIDLEDYQLDPVVRATNDMPRANLLIADDVGLGKTIEAGLVIQGFILRQRARTVLVVCPSSLQLKWQDEMRDKFGLEFRIVDSTLLKDLRRKRGLHTNPWTHFPRLITSIDYIKRDRPMRLVRERVLPREGESMYPRRFDILVLDEAHGVAPSSMGRYATDSQRTQALRTLVPHFEHKLFLTATPHNGYPESFTALLELLDNQRFARGVEPARDQLNVVMVRRLKSELKDWDGSPRFPERRLLPIEVDYSNAEREVHEALRQYTAKRLKGAEGTERFATEFVLKTLKKRLFSCPAAFKTTLEQHETSLTTAQKHSPTIHRPSLGLLRRQVDVLEEEFGDDEVFETAASDTLDAASRLFRPPSPDEQALLKLMRDWARSAVTRPDAKAASLIRWLDTTLRPGGQWTDRRVIIFTEYRATQKWLQGLLATHGLTEGGRLSVLYGGMKPEDREAIKAAFQAGPEDSAVRILLATDAASEGIDLQNHCARLIHYEIPWNPNRLEQRNGRVDRHGQKGYDEDDGSIVRAVLIHHFVGKGYNEHKVDKEAEAGDLDGDLEFLFRAVRKVQNIRQDLGKVGAVIAEQVEEAMLGRRRRLDTSEAEHKAEPARKMLQFERNVSDQIKKLMVLLKDSKDFLNLSPANVEDAVQAGLELAGKPPLQPGPLPHTWRIPLLDASWAHCQIGLAHPHTRVIRPITFDAQIARGRDDVVLAHLEHRLVQQCLRLLRAQVWQRGERLRRVTARTVSGSVLDSPAVVVYARLVVTGGDSRRLHEDIITAGGMLVKGRFEEMNVGQVDGVLKALTNDLPGEAIRLRLSRLWDEPMSPGQRTLADHMRKALETRMQVKRPGLLKLIEEQARKEQDNVVAILDELERAIRKQLQTPLAEQLLIQFEEYEREQLQRDTRSLEERLRQIPSEKVREVAHVRAHFSNPTLHLFPVAVTFLVPQHLA